MRNKKSPIRPSEIKHPTKIDYLKQLTKQRYQRTNLALSPVNASGLWPPPDCAEPADAEAKGFIFPVLPILEAGMVALRFDGLNDPGCGGGAA